MAFLFFGGALVLAIATQPLVAYIKPPARLFWLLPIFLLSLPFVKKIELTPWTPGSLVYPVYDAKVETVDFQAGNFTMHIPSKAPPAKGYWCYCAKLPCTPFPKKNVVMRGNSYQDGFRCDTTKEK
jgi:hypothetical protein